VPVLALLPVRGLAFSRHRARIAEDSPDSEQIFRLPWRELRADLLTWAAAGLAMVALYEIFYEPYISTGIKVFVGCMSFGLFGGMLSYLNAERRLIDRLQDGKAAGPPPRQLFSVSRKMMIMIVTLLVFMAGAVLLMVLLDVYYLLENPGMPEPEIYWGIFKEIMFALAVLLAISMTVVGRYSKNLKKSLAIQLGALDRISRGDLEARVPLLTDDEFARIAAKTNEMIQGLKERDICQVRFGRYVSPEISRRILNGEISADGELVEATILFCDLRGYTSFVEKKSPADVVRFLNRYFTEMEQAIRESGGIVLQYIGDEIEAVFGTPAVPSENHTERAVTAALAMRRALERLNAQRRQAGEPDIRHGVGIHCGTVLAGNVGSPERLVYAMVGDAVNVASRLQVLNKRCGTDILVSRNVVERLSGAGFEFVPMGTFPIRGKTEQIEVFSPSPGKRGAACRADGTREQDGTERRKDNET
jgi:class 3 adenylate cyclase